MIGDDKNSSSQADLTKEARDFPEMCTLVLAGCHSLLVVDRKCVVCPFVPNLSFPLTWNVA